MCVTYGKGPDLVFSGGATGKVYIWQGNALKNTVQAHEGPVFAMQVLEKVPSTMWHCVVTQNIHTPPKKGVEIPGRQRFSKNKQYKEICEV